MPRKPKTDTVKPPQLCICGCEEQTSGRPFRPGHDARFHGMLHRGEVKMSKRLASRVLPFLANGEVRYRPGMEGQEPRVCDDRCRFAFSNICTNCACGGSEHGTGWAHVRPDSEVEETESEVSGELADVS